MPVFNFLFGKDARRAAPLSDRLKHGAKAQLESRVMRNPVNRWWVVLLRRYLFWPMVKLPFLPVIEALHARKLLSSFERAAEILHDNGFRTKVEVFGPLRHARARGHGYGEALMQTAMGILWKPRYRGASKEHIGHIILWERFLCNKIFGAVVLGWLASIMLWALAFTRLIHEGLRPVMEDLGRIWGHSNVFSVAVYGHSSAFRTWELSFLVWAVCLGLGFALVNRPWIRLSAAVKDFIRGSGSFKPDEVDNRMLVLAMPEAILVSTPSMDIKKVRTIPNGWPMGFQPGEIVETSKRPEDVLIIRRPERKPIIFGGEHARDDIGSYLKPYETKILSHMGDAVKKKSDSELIFVGEVVDPRWWISTQVYLPLSTSPHLFICGQTRSGKTKSALSFVYSFARANPDTVWYFADGKGSPDYDPFADYLSAFPVAKPDDKTGDTLIQFANVVEDVWSEFKRRRLLFDKARVDGKPCSTIYQYRELVGPLPQVWLVVDEFSVFVSEMGWLENWRNDTTLAGRLKLLSSGAASYGIHLLFASQRYQVSDLPSEMRTNFTTKMVHNVQMSDANFLETPEATSLDSGVFFVTAAGLFCRHTGITKVKAKLPYIGDKPIELLEQTVKPVDKSTKREFDIHLVYNKGSNDLEKMSVSELCVRLQRFFKNQDYLSTELVTDFEATELQIKMIKSRQVQKTREDGSPYTELVPIKGAPVIGVSVLRADEVDEETIYGIQDKHSNYDVILIFVAGKTIQSSKYKFLERVNELSTRFYLVPFREYNKDMRFVEMERKKGVMVDVILPKLLRLGISDGDSTAAARGLSVDDISPKSPVKLKLAKIMELTLLTNGTQNGEYRGIPFTSTVLPGGTPLVFLIVSGKVQRDEARSVALGRVEQGETVVVVTNEKLTQSDTKAITSTGRAAVWKVSQVDETLSSLESDEQRRRFVGNLMKELGLVKTAMSGSFAVVQMGIQASITISGQVIKESGKVVNCQLRCATTGYSMVTIPSVDLDRYRLDYLGIPETAKIAVRSGLAPLGASPENTTLALDPGAEVVAFGEHDKWDNVGGILVRRKSAIAEDDPLLSLMKKTT